MPLNHESCGPPLPGAEIHGVVRTITSELARSLGSILHSSTFANDAIQHEEPIDIVALMAQIQDCAEDMAYTLGALQLWLDILSGRKVLHCQVIDLDRLIRDTTSKFEPTLRRKAISVRVSGGRACSAIGDQEVLQESFQWILSKVVQNCGEGASIHVSLFTKGPWATITLTTRTQALVETNFDMTVSKKLLELQKSVVSIKKTWLRRVEFSIAVPIQPDPGALDGCATIE